MVIEALETGDDADDEAEIMEDEDDDDDEEEEDDDEESGEYSWVVTETSRSLLPSAQSSLDSPKVAMSGG